MKKSLYELFIYRQFLVSSFQFSDFVFNFAVTMKTFDLHSSYQPTGDQPEAIRQLTEGVLNGLPAQTLLGVTGSGKTFTIANVIKNVNKPLPRN